MFGRGPPFTNPFENDPFFQDPFAQMDNIMRSMLNHPGMAAGHMPPMGPMGPMGMMPMMPMMSMMPMMPPIGFGQMPFAGHPNTAPRNGTAVVEELDDENPGEPNENDDEPIVEEPDEGSPDQHANAAQPTRTAAHPSLAYAQAGQGMLPTFGGLGGNSSSVYSFSSSSYTSTGGPNGVTYSASTTTRQGPGQVRETQSTVRDGRTGQQSITISRGLKDKARTVTRTRDASGREVTQNLLQGVEEAQASQFDRQWRSEAERNLPPAWGGRGAGPRMHAAAHSSRQPALTLPYAGGQQQQQQQQGSYQSGGQGYAAGGSYQTQDARQYRD